MVRGFNQARKSLNLGLRDPKAMEYYRELLELGVTNTNVRMGDLKILCVMQRVFRVRKCCNRLYIKTYDARALGRGRRGCRKREREQLVQGMSRLIRSRRRFLESNNV